MGKANVNSILSIVGGSVLIVALLIAVGWLVRNLVRDNRTSLLASLSFRPEQSVSVGAGPVVVMVEAPRFSDDLRNFKISVLDQRNGSTAAFSQGHFKPRAKVSGVSTVKIPYGRLEGNVAGELVIRVEGLQPNHDYSAYRIVLSRPFGARLALQIIGIVFCSVGILLSILGICWAAGLLKVSG